ncbi:MAG TPA: outer membrane beta-barrel protein [Gemmatimonadales bacterium]
MITRSSLSAALVLSLLAPAVLSAQAASDRPRLVFFANGGGNSPVTDLNEAGTASLKTGWTAGAGVGVQVNPYLAIRGSFNFARSEGEGPAAGLLTGQKLNHYFYGGDVQLRYPTSSGFAPYLLLGAGAVTIDNTDLNTFERFTKFAGKGGLGVEYVLPRSNVGLFVQGTTYVYGYDRGGFDKTQVDLLWTGGLSYRLPL